MRLENSLLWAEQKARRFWYRCCFISERDCNKSIIHESKVGKIQQTAHILLHPGGGLGFSSTRTSTLASELTTHTQIQKMLIQRENVIILHLFWLLVPIWGAVNQQMWRKLFIQSLLKQLGQAAKQTCGPKTSTTHTVCDRMSFASVSGILLLHASACSHSMIKYLQVLLKVTLILFSLSCESYMQWKSPTSKFFLILSCNTTTGQTYPYILCPTVKELNKKKNL